MDNDILKLKTGRNREHQGLAAAIVKLWEKSAIAKIAVKRGVPNTSNEIMAEEIKVFFYFSYATFNFGNSTFHVFTVSFTGFTRKANS